MEEARSNAATRIRAMVEEVIADSPMFVIDVEIRGRKGSQVVDIFVDSDEDLDVEALARISREVDFMLDMEEDLIPGKYNLNVSSPGADRPLVLPRQFRKHVGRELLVHYRKEDGTGDTEVRGQLVTADADGIEIEAARQEPRRVAYEQIAWAKVQLPW